MYSLTTLNLQIVSQARGIWSVNVGSTLRNRIKDRSFSRFYSSSPHLCFYLTRMCSLNRLGLQPKKHNCISSTLRWLSECPKDKTQHMNDNTEARTPPSETLPTSKEEVVWKCLQRFPVSEFVPVTTLAREIPDEVMESLSEGLTKHLLSFPNRYIVKRASSNGQFFVRQVSFPFQPGNKVRPSSQELQDSKRQNASPKGRTKNNATSTPGPSGAILIPKLSLLDSLPSPLCFVRTPKLINLAALYDLYRKIHYEPSTELSDTSVNAKTSASDFVEKVLIASASSIRLFSLNEVLTVGKSIGSSGGPIPSDQAIDLEDSRTAYFEWKEELNINSIKDLLVEYLSHKFGTDDAYYGYMCKETKRLSFFLHVLHVNRLIPSVVPIELSMPRLNRCGRTTFPDANDLVRFETRGLIQEYNYCRLCSLLSSFYTIPLADFLQRAKDFSDQPPSAVLAVRHEEEKNSWIIRDSESELAERKKMIEGEVKWQNELLNAKRKIEEKKAEKQNSQEQVGSETPASIPNGGLVASEMAAITATPPPPPPTTTTTTATTATTATVPTAAVSEPTGNIPESFLVDNSCPLILFYQRDAHGNLIASTSSGEGKPMIVSDIRFNSSPILCKRFFPILFFQRSEDELRAELNEVKAISKATKRFTLYGNQKRVVFLNRRHLLERCLVLHDFMYTVIPMRGGEMVKLSEEDRHRFDILHRQTIREDGMNQAQNTMEEMNDGPVFQPYHHPDILAYSLYDALPQTAHDIIIQGDLPRILAKSFLASLSKAQEGPEKALLEMDEVIKPLASMLIDVRNRKWLRRYPHLFVVVERPPNFFIQRADVAQSVIELMKNQKYGEEHTDNAHEAVSPDDPDSEAINKICSFHDHNNALKEPGEILEFMTALVASRLQVAKYKKPVFSSHVNKFIPPSLRKLLRQQMKTDRAALAVPSSNSDEDAFKQFENNSTVHYLRKYPDIFILKLGVHPGEVQVSLVQHLDPRDPQDNIP